jgi:pimeloyl-ACP methyl ester carboxylesterase
MVFFHGFGQNFKAFEAMYAEAGKTHSLLAPDLFFHGESERLSHSGKPVELGEWLAVLDEIWARFNPGRAHWVAYSMGAKLALAGFQERPAFAASVTLLAPDGIDLNPWYRTATQTVAGRLVLRFFLRVYPALGLLILVLKTLRLIKPGLLLFAETALRSPEARKQVRSVWLGFRLLWPDENRWFRNLREEPVPFTIFLGKKDSVMPPSRFAPYKKRWGHLIRWVELDSGHARLPERVAEVWKKERARG